MPAIIKGINDRKTKVFVIRPCDDTDLSVYKDSRIEIKSGSKINIIALIKFMFFVLKDRDGIYHLLNTGPYYLLIVKLLGIKKVVYGIRGTIYWYTKFQELLRKAIWKLAISPKMIFTANSHYSSEVFTSTVTKKVKPIILYNPIDPEKFKLKKQPAEQKEIKIIYAGRLVKSKNLHKWINAAVFLIENGVKAKFELYGAGPCAEELEELVRKAGQGDKILLKGHVKQIENVYKEADLLLFLSAFESFGNVAVESILCGTPVVTFDIPSMKEIFSDYPEVLIANDGDYRESILNKVKNISELKESAVKASAVFSQRFGYDKHIKSLNNIYAGLT